MLNRNPDTLQEQQGHSCHNRPSQYPNPDHGNLFIEDAISEEQPKKESPQPNENYAICCRRLSPPLHRGIIRQPQGTSGAS